MKFTRFLKLRRAVESLDPNLIRNKIRRLEELLYGRGLPLEPQNTAITQEGIFYIEPESGIATKVVLYDADFEVPDARYDHNSFAASGYTNPKRIEQFKPYHVMRCNELVQLAQKGWKGNYNLTKRSNGEFFFRIVSASTKEQKVKVHQEISNQRLFICEACLWKVSSLIVDAQGVSRQAFNLEKFFDVDFVRAWNSQGVLAKNYGFTRDMYPEDWQEISRIRKEHLGYHCQSCHEDLSHKRLQQYLHVVPTDHVEGREGYVRLECQCIGCLVDHFADNAAVKVSSKEQREYEEFRVLLRTGV